MDYISLKNIPRALFITTESEKEKAEFVAVISEKKQYIFCCQLKAHS